MNDDYTLYPIGFGGGLSSLPTNCWYMIIKDRLYLFDCPFEAVKFFSSTKGKDLLKKIKRVVVFISHLHEDHIGGISNLSWLIGKKYEKEIWVFAHTKIIMPFLNYLEITQCDLVDITVTRGDYYQDDNIQLLCREVVHTGAPAFSFVIYGKYHFLEGDGDNWCVYYSGDTRNFMDKSMIESFLKDPETKLIYHEFTFDADSDIHCYKDRVIKAIPKPLRKYITPMHLDRIGDVKRCEKLGFNIPKEYYDELEEWNRTQNKFKKSDKN